LIAGLTGCAGPLSTLAPSGPAAASIAGLWWVMLAGSAVLFALVLVLFALVMRQPGWGSRMSPARWIVLGGLVLPAVILIPLIGYALFAGERLLPLPGHAPARIDAVAKQWNCPQARPSTSSSPARTSCTRSGFRASRARSTRSPDTPRVCVCKPINPAATKGNATSFAGWVMQGCTSR
jgi:hypothetical protein